MIHMATTIPVYDENNKKVSEVALPSLFHEQIRPDLISRVVLAIEANSRQPYGAYDHAGQNVSAKLSRRRRDYKASYGHGISRVPRKILSRNWVGALAPGTVKGRRAHPPKPYKDWSQKVLFQEKRKATKSALSATMLPELVKKRGHKIPSTFPFILDDSFESLKTTKTVVSALRAIGFKEELERAGKRKHNAGKASMRGRATSFPKSVLFVISNPAHLVKAASNIPGVEVVLAKDVNAKNRLPDACPED
jgi:large subunit ribosomal protein L4e